MGKCGLTCVGLRESTADSAKVPGNYAGVVGASNMSTLLAVAPRVFAEIADHFEIRQTRLDMEATRCRVRLTRSRMQRIWFMLPN
jgi:hypothetical protein